MKPGMAWREEPWWFWDWPGRPSQQLTGGPSVGNLGSPEGEHQVSWKYIYVPDPTERSGWRQSIVWTDPPKPPDQRKLGYR